MQAVGLDLVIELLRDYPGFSQFTLLSIVLGFVIFSLGFRKFAIWQSANAAEKLLLSLGLGVCVNILALFPACSLVLVLLGLSLDVNLFLTSNLAAVIGAIIIMVFGRAHFEPHPFILGFKRVLWGIFATSWIGAATALAVLFTVYIFPHDSLSQGLVLSGSWVWFGTMMTAGAYATLGYLVFRFAFFKKIYDLDKMIDGKNKETLKEIRMPKRFLGIFGIVVISMSIVLTFVDSNAHIFTPYVIEEKERFTASNPYDNPLFADLIVFGDNNVESTFYRDAFRTYTIKPAMLQSFPLSMNSTRISDPSNTDTQFSFGAQTRYASSNTCYCVYLQLPEGVKAARSNKDITITYPKYVNTIIANATYTLQMRDTNATIRSSSLTNIGAGNQTQRIDIVISNNENTVIWIRKLDLASYNVVDNTDLTITVDGKKLDPTNHGVDEKPLWVEVQPHSTSRITITYFNAVHV